MQSEWEPGYPERTELGLRMGIQILRAEPGLTVARMPVEGNRQIAGVLHGGATAALCETAASTAAYLHARSMSDDSAGLEQRVDPDFRPTDGYIAVGTDLNIAHLRTSRTGYVTVEATAAHLGRRTTVHRLEVKDDQGRLIATGTARNMIVPLGSA